MAGKKKKIDAILKRAHKLFDAQNYLLAEKEFEKARKKAPSSDIDEKLDICRQKTRSEKGKMLVKKGHSAIKNNALQEAISCFTRAQQFLDDPGLSEKIQELEQQLQVGSIHETAGNAEKSGDYGTAAALYEQIWQETGQQRFCIRSGVCHVKAGNEDQAIRIFHQAKSLDDVGCYYYGFALAKTGQYPEAIIAWEKINTRISALTSQKIQVLSLAFSTLYHALEKGTDIENIRSRAGQLQAVARTLNQSALTDKFDTLYHYCSIALLEIWWEQENYEKIAGLLEHETRFNTLEFMALKAKTCYHLAKKNEAFLYPMVQSWFTAIFFHNPADKFIDNPEELQQIHQQLIRLAEQRIDGHTDSQTVRQAAALFAVEKKLITDMEAMYRASGSDTPHICTPFYAAITGQSEKILSDIRKNRNFFKDPDHYLETGGFYSRAWKGLYTLQTEDVDKAHDVMETFLETDAPWDEFVEYVVARVRFAYGQACLERGEKKVLPFFSSTPALFDAAPSIEQRFADRMAQYNGDRLAEYETVLKWLYKKRPSPPVARALSAIMSTLAVSRYNKNQFNDQQLAAILKNALDIHPENQYARYNLNQTRIDIQKDDIQEALYKNKMGKAADIVLESEFPEMEAFFFSEAQDMLHMLCTTIPDKDFLTIMLHRLRDACESVDETHELVEQIDDKLMNPGKGM
ncbi:MAG: tetratricopeptide repeat protein [Desulfotignum sp.]